MNRLWRNSFVILLVVLSAFSGTLWANMQFADGAFVVGGDGSRWVVSGGVKYAINWTLDDRGALDSLPEGPAINTIHEIAAGGVPGPAPAAEPAAPAGPGLTADYQFQDNLASVVGGAPALLTLGPTDFATDRV